MQTEKPRQPLQNSGKPSLAAYKAAAESKKSKEEQLNLDNLLFDAAILGDNARIRMLIDEGANIDISIYGCTALMRAADNGHTETCALLLDEGANIEAKDAGGWTALMHAAWEGHKETCALLLEKGANIKAMNRSGRVSFEVARFNRRKEMAAFLILYPMMGTEKSMAFLSAFTECVSGGL